jgi:hypothetical protein
MTRNSPALKMPAHFPYPQAPSYCCGKYGAWTLKKKAGHSYERGYFTGLGDEPPGYYLVRGGDIWMSTSRLERESHAVHLKYARGNVVVCGVGMGLYLYNIASRDQVQRIVAVDLDPSVIELVRNATRFESWPGRGKIRFVNRDALELSALDIGLEPVDYLYVDIWPELGNPQALPQTQAIQSVVKAATVGWWGQEIDFIEWLFTHRQGHSSPSARDFIDFMEETGLPIEEQSAAFLTGCRQAGSVFADYGSLPFALAAREGRRPLPTTW